MTFDRLRCTEAATQAAIVLVVVTLPGSWRALDLGLAAVLGAMWLVLTGAVYSLHAVTFDCFRLTKGAPDSASGELPAAPARIRG